MESNKNYMEQLMEIAELKDGWGIDGSGKSFSKLCIERCERMLQNMNIKPDIRATIEEGICFDLYADKIDAEIVVDTNEISGFMTINDIDTTTMIFETENDAVNFWNIITELAE